MNRKKIIILIFAAILLFFGTYTYNYLTEYMPSLINEKSALENISNVNLIIDEKLIRISPQEKSEIGIIFYPGGKVDYKAYMRLGALISQYGYEVFIPKMPLNFAIFDIDRAKEIMDTNSNIKNWYLSGHSLGGASISEFYKKNKNSVEGIIFLASYPNFDISTEKIKVLGIFASEDGLINKEKREEKLNNFPENSSFVLDGGNHAGFGNYGIQKNDGIAKITEEQQQKITAEKINEFIIKK